MLQHKVQRVSLHHIAHTIDNGRQLIDFDKNSFVMVLQGWEISDYLTCIDYARQQGLITPVIGIGTMCCRKDTKDVYELLKQIKFALPDYCKMHCFGLSIDMLKHKEIFDFVDSIDTFAWSRRFGLVQGISSTDESRICVLKEYISKVNMIINDNSKKRSLL